MLGLGWTEMMVIGIAALVFIGPKDLPVVMHRVGKIIGQIRRMGNEFQREINKTTGLDEVRNLRNSITAPLKKTSDEIRREFNAMTPTGPKPSGLIKPADPKAESVVDEIKAQAGMLDTKPANAAEVAPPVMTALTPDQPQPVKAIAVQNSPIKAQAVPTSPVTTSDLPALDAVPAPAESQPINMDEPVKKPRARKAPVKKDVLPTEPADSPAAPTPKASAPRKPKTAPTDTSAGNE
jgi:sec-independent protein translocase protein TatB